MKLTFSKKNKEISIENLHRKQLSPKKDWLFMVSVFSITIFVVVVVSVFVFYNLLHGGDSGKSDQIGTEEVLVDIDMTKLNSALEFINSRKSVLPAGIGPTSKP